MAPRFVMEGRSLFAAEMPQGINRRDSVLHCSCTVTLTGLESGESLRLPQGDLEGFLTKERREDDAGESAAEGMPKP